MSRTVLAFKNTTTIPHPLPHTRSTLLSTSNSDVERILLLSPIASDYAFVRTEPVYFPPTSVTTPSTASTSSFPDIQLPTPETPANGVRVHFTYYETVVLFYGLINTKFPLNGWFAVPDGGDVGFVEIIAKPQAKEQEQVVVRKVKCLVETEGQTEVVEEMTVSVRWWTKWISRKTADETFSAIVGSYKGLFEE